MCSTDDNNLIHKLLENSAKAFPDKVALIHQEKRVTYSDINHGANQIAAFLIGHGIKKGSRIPLMFKNSVDYVIGYYGILKAGAVVVPMGTDLKPENLSFFLNELEAEIIIASGQFERLLKATDLAILGIKSVVLTKPSSSWSDKTIEIIDFENIIQAHEGLDPSGSSIDPNDLANIIYTSGSTGTPKGVMLSHRNVVENTKSICEYLELSNTDIQMVVLPFFYVMGQSLLNTHIAVGGTLVINNTFAYTATVVQQMIDEKVTGFSGVPSTYAYLLHRSPLKARKNELINLRYCSQAGGHMARHLKLSLKEALPDHTSIYIMYGATEASARLAYLEPSQLAIRPDSIGKAIPGVDLYVGDKEGRPVPHGQVGELIANGPNIMKGYFKDPELTEKKLNTNGYHTGDLCYKDEEGFFFLTGREDDLIKVGGHRINPQEIEDAVMASDLIVEVAVIGISDSLLGNKLVAIAVKRDECCTEINILNFCNQVLPRFKHPSQFIFVRSLPKKYSGKIDRVKCLDVIMNETKIQYN